MKFYKLNGKIVEKNIEKFRINWKADSKSKFQFGVKEFLYPFWKNHICYEELVLAGTKLSLDIVNLTHRIAVEVHGKQHSEYVPFFHDKKEKFFDQCFRDVKKQKWCELNKFQLVEIYTADLPLTLDFFKERYDIEL